MSYAAVRAQLVTIIEAVSLSSTAEFGAFQQRKDAHPTLFMRTRNFGIAVEAARASTASTAASAQWKFADVTAWFDYEHLEDGALVDENIGADFDALVNALLDETTWGRPSSTIENITGPEMTTERLDNDDGFPIGIRVNVTFQVLHTNL